MPEITTINEIKTLNGSGFGKPYPRHGLKLLHWFVQKYVRFDDFNNMFWRYDPEEGYFGLHLFKNRPDSYGQKLLPDVHLKYYEVGNLRKQGPHGLPYYIQEDCIKNPNQSESNMDRIIFSVEDQYIAKVYVTAHKRDRNCFDEKATYCISKGLMTNIGKLSLGKFLCETGYSTTQDHSDREYGGLTLETGSIPINGNLRPEMEDSVRINMDDAHKDVDRKCKCCDCIIM